jgi:hypothetical protein
MVSDNHICSAIDEFFPYAFLQSIMCRFKLISSMDADNVLVSLLLISLEIGAISIHIAGKPVVEVIRMERDMHSADIFCKDGILIYS